MATTAAASQGLSPGFKFDPTVSQLLRCFLLPYLRYRLLPVRGAVFLDDPTEAPPWTLLNRHGRGNQDEAYFIGPAAADEVRGGRQQVSRSVATGGKWVKQRAEGSGRVIFLRETFEWEESSLSFQADDDRRSGSTGWVMHEYVIVPPPGSAVAATHRASHITFTGHGQKRKRVPDGYVAVGVQLAAASAPPPSLMLCKPPQSGASYRRYLSDQKLLPAAEQSNQEYAYKEQNQQLFLPPERQSSQDYFPVAEQSNQEHVCDQQDHAYEQQHLIHGDLTTWQQEHLATSQQFLDQEQALFTGLGGGLVISNIGEHIAAPAAELLPVEHGHGAVLPVDGASLFKDREAHLIRESSEKEFVDDDDEEEAQLVSQEDGAGDSAMARSASAGAPPSQQPSATLTLKHFLHQLQAAVLAGLNGQPPAEPPAAQGYRGLVPTVDSAFLEKMKAYLMIDAKKTCGIAVVDRDDAPTNGEHGDAPPPVLPDTLTELERVVGLLLGEVVHIIKVAATSGSSDKPLSNIDKALNSFLPKLMAIFNRVAMS